MGTASIKNVELIHWHLGSHLVQLNPPLKKFDVDTGEAVLHEYVICHVKEGGFGRGIDVFPTNANAEFVNDTMQVISRTSEEWSLDEYLEKLGYEKVEREADDSSQ